MNSDESRSPRPTIRFLAAKLGVCPMTVSLALRRSPKISLATRERVQVLADKLGYRPDPQVAKLMHHLRKARTTRYKSTIVALTTMPATNQYLFHQEVAAGAERRAGQLGFGFSLFRICDPDAERQLLRRMLSSRGVEGVLLLPMRTPADLSGLVDWNAFSVVAATSGVRAPAFHRVQPDQYGNTLQLCQQLVALGYRRIGLVQERAHDVIVRHGFSGAVAWQSVVGGTVLVPPLLHENGNLVDVPAWFRRARPDVIIAPGDRDCREIARRLGLSIPGPVGFVSANKSGHSIFAGIEERPTEIGMAAINLLSGMIQHGEKGVPAVPAAMMITGQWVAGDSLPDRRRGRAAPPPGRGKAAQ